jgi:hypothetical protein
MVGTDGDVPKVPSKHIFVKKIKMTRKRGTARTLNSVAKKPMKSSTAATSVKNSCRAVPKPTSNATTASFGLPAFRFEANKPLKSGWTNDHCKNGDGSRVQHEVDDDDSSSFYPHSDGPEEDIPSDTLMAIHSLIQSDRGLHVPTTNNGSVQVILESQVYSIFDENHVSTVNAELLELIHTNKVQRLSCHDMCTMAFIRTEDYARAVWDSHSHNEMHLSLASFEKVGSSDTEIVSWFLAQLHHWTKLSITESFLEDRWETSNNDNNMENTGIKPKDVVRYLLNAQFLIRDPKQNMSSGGSKEDSYFLWLPNWGIVLKTWNEARRQFLTLLAQRKEMSKANVLQKNRHSHISTSFLLNELLSNEKIRVVERPFGSFIQLVKDT